MKFSAPKQKNANQAAIVGLVVVMLAVIIINQAVWLNNMYRLHQRELYNNSNQAAQEAVWKEIAERTEEIGGHMVFSTNMNMSNPGDTSRFFTKKVISEDSTYYFTIDKQEPNKVPKMIQFLLKKELPVNLDKLNTIFKAKIEQSHKVTNTYFDYIDLDADTLISTNKPAGIKANYYVKTDTVVMDIVSSIGVVGYVFISDTAVLDRMMFQLLLSVLLIITAMVCLFYISRSFVFQWKAEKMRQESVNVMTHEFKRPISSAVAMASLIPFYMEKQETDKVLDYTRNIRTDLNKLTYYTQRIQQISNNEKGNLQLNPTRVEIIPFFESLKNRYESAENGLAETVLYVEIATSKKEMKVDLLHFSNVMDNLVENAIKYTPMHPVVIHIRVSDAAEGLNISVKDSGIGISSTDKKYVFDKFYRVKREETKNKVGFGLGLTYVKSIVEEHGGTISVNSELNKGSEFIITLKD